MGITFPRAEEFWAELVTKGEEQLASAKLLQTQLSDFRFVIACGISVAAYR
jgi:hypothetical protein